MPYPMATPEVAVQRARYAATRPIRYHLGGGTDNPTSTPPSELDCTGGIAWFFGLPRSKAGLESTRLARGLVTDYFDRVQGPARPGDVLAYGDAGGHEGHAALVTEVYSNGRPKTMIDVATHIMSARGTACGEEAADWMLRRSPVLLRPRAQSQSVSVGVPAPATGSASPGPSTTRAVQFALNAGAAPDTVRAIINASNATGVPFSLMVALGHVESKGTFNPDITGDNGASIGIFQVQPGTANISASQLRDPRTNATAAARLLAEIFARRRNVRTTLLEYNHGRAGADRVLASNPNALEPYEERIFSLVRSFGP